MQRLRNALWGLWLNKTRAVIQVRDFSAKDAPPSEIVYFIEPDESGKWSIAIEVERDHWTRYRTQEVTGHCTSARTMSIE